MPGPGVGDIILQAAQGIVAMKQGQQRIALQSRQLDQQHDAQLDAQKAREEGLKLREQNAKLQEDQLQLSRERFDEQNKQFEATQTQQQSQFDERMVFVAQNAEATMLNALRGSVKNGQIDLAEVEKKILELKKLKGGVAGQESVEFGRRIQRTADLRSQVIESRYRDAQQRFTSDRNRNPNMRARFTTLTSPRALQSALDKALAEQIDAEGLSRAAGEEIPQLVAAREKVKDLRGITDYLNELNVSAEPSMDEIYFQADQNGIPRSSVGELVDARQAANEATDDFIGPQTAIQLVDTGIRTGNFEGFVATSKLERDATGKITEASLQKIFTAVAARLTSKDDVDKVYRNLENAIARALPQNQ